MKNKKDRLEKYLFYNSKKIKRLIKDDKIRDLDILRLLSLYTLRYERHASNELNTLKYEAQKHRRFPEKYIHVSNTF
jgi:hypothetical protein